MWTCGFLQSTSVTTPLNVCGLLSSNLAEMGWCAEPTVPSSSTATSAKASVTPDFIKGLLCIANGMCLLPTDLQLTALALVLPGTHDRPVLEREVFDLAIDDVVQHARLVLDVRLEVHDPAVRIQGCVLDRRIVGSRVEHSGDGFSVPVQDEDDVVAV